MLTIRNYIINPINTRIGSSYHSIIRIFSSLCSADYLVSLTYMDDLWQLTETNSSEIKQFIFSRKQPKSNNVNEIWRLVSDARSEMHQTKYDAYVRTLFTLFDKKVNPRIQFTDINDVWNRFMGLFMKIGGIVTYAPVFKSYYKHAMKEMLEDGVQYLEFRGLLPEVLFVYFLSYNF